MKEKNILIIFTRNPELGKVKTRLAKDIGDKKALEIYIFLLEHTAKVAKRVNSNKVVYFNNREKVKDKIKNNR